MSIIKLIRGCLTNSGGPRARWRRPWTTSRLVVELLEDRVLLSADNVFARFDGVAPMPSVADHVAVTVTPNDFTLAGRKVVLGFHVQPGDGPGSILHDPAPVAVRNPRHNLVKPAYSRAFLSGRADHSLVLVALGRGTYDLAVPGENASAGGFVLEVFLAGDADGNGTVNRRDMRLVHSLLGVREGDGRYRTEADANLNGKIGRFDLRRAKRNAGDGTRLSPLGQAVMLSPATVQLPDGTLATTMSSSTLSGTATPGSSLALEADGDGLFDEGDRVADASGHFSFAVTLSSGSNTLQVRSTDGFGQVRTSAPLRVTLDTESPALVLDGPSSGRAVNGNLAAAGRVTDDLSVVASFQGQVDDGPFSDVAVDAAGNFRFSTALPLDGSADGPHTLTVRAADQAGNVRTASRSFTLDTTPPVLTVTSPADGLTTSTNVTVAGSVAPGVSGLASLQWQLDAGPFADVAVDAGGAFSFAAGLALDGSADGPHALRLRATDQAGNVAVTDVAFRLDSMTGAPPLNMALVLDGPSSRLAVNSNLTATGLVTGDLSALASFQGQVDDGPFSDVAVDAAGNFRFSTALPLDGSADGPHTLTVRAADQAGNVQTASRSFTLDTTPPVLTLTSPADGLTTSTDVTVAGSVAAVVSGLASLQWRLDAGPFADVAVDAQGAFTFAAGLALDGSADGSHTLRLQTTDQASNVAVADVAFTLDSMDAGAGAPPVNMTVATTLADATRFLYTGAHPVQTGVNPDTISVVRAAVLRGRAWTRDGTPLAGVTVTVVDHAEFGTSTTDVDGTFNMAVNGGGLLTLRYVKDGYLPVQRQMDVPWQDYAALPDVVMIRQDSQVTTIDLTAAIPMQLARGSVMTDADGSRQAAVLFPQGTHAQVFRPDGSTQDVSTLHVRFTEYTVGDTGPLAMPGDLPPTSGYTYAVGLNADEATVKIDGKDVLFSQPVLFYQENFLDFPVGMDVPTGYYDNDHAAWVPSLNGRVVAVVGITGGVADVDADGDGTADATAALAALGITDAERQSLAGLYQPGQSLWRVPLTHFSNWDHNWGTAPDCSAGANCFPNQPQPQGGGKREIDPDDPDIQCGSIIQVQTQILGETVGVAGTPFTLHYASDRVPGRVANRTLHIPLTGTTIPATLQGVRLRVYVGGRTFPDPPPPPPPGFPFNPNWGYGFPATTDLSTNFTWDGKDAFGRDLQGEQTAVVYVGYVYGAYYLKPGESAASFGSSGGTAITTNSARQEFVFWQRSVTTLGGWNAQVEGLGGWGLDVQHRHDTTGKVLYLGNCTRRSADAQQGGVLQTVAGGGQGNPDNGGRATDALLFHPNVVAAAADGTVYIGTDSTTISRLNLDGTIGAVAKFRWKARALAVGPDGSLYVAQGDSPFYDGHLVLRVRRDGTVTTVAGAGFGLAGFSGDGGPANQAQLSEPRGVAVGPDGSVYIADSDNNRIRRVDPSGIINTVAGTGSAGFSGDGGPAIQAQLNSPAAIALGPDGSLYIADFNNNRVRRVSPDGLITTVAGNGRVVGCCPTGDGGLATAAQVTPKGLALGPDGGLYILASSVVRRVDADGIITLAVGGTFGLSREGSPAVGSSLADAGGIALAPDGSLYIADSNNHRVRRVAPALPGLSFDDIVIPSEDGSEVYAFTKEGRHLRTLNALTGAIRYEFTYDNAGRLTRVTDGDSNVTTVERDGDGNPTAIVAPGGQRTALALNADGYLSAITDPAGNAVNLTYQAAAGPLNEGAGLLATLTDERGNIHRFTYESSATRPQDPLSWGRLINDEDAAGGFTALSRTPTPTGYQVTTTTAEGRVSTYAVSMLATGEVVRVNTDPAGGRTEAHLRPDGSRTVTYPDGTRVAQQLGPDPRWGMLAPLVVSQTTTTPAGETATLTTTRTVTLADAKNPLSVQTLTSTVTVRGQSFVTTYNATAHTLTDTTPEGRQTVNTIDDQGRPLQIQATGLEAVRLAYDSRGRLISASQGTGGQSRALAFSYNSDNSLDTYTDPLGQAVRFAYDAAGRVTQQTMADGRVIGYAYDASGNLTALTPPDQPAHTFTYSPADLPSSNAAPDASAPAPNPTRFNYNLDQQLSRVVLPDGQAADLVYDSAGRLNTMTLPNGQLRYGYDPVTGHLTSLAAPGGVGLAYAYDGDLLTRTTWTGPVAGSVTRTYDNDFRTTALRVNNGSAVTFAYDKDGLLKQAGNLTLTRDPRNGLLTGTTLGNVTDGWTYNGPGEAVGYSAANGGTALYDVQYTRDLLGRITQKFETLGGVTDTYDYAYDQAGRLAEVRKNGSVGATYAYDGNGNRLSRTDPGGSVTASYDDQDRLLSYGTTTYRYTATGDLLSQTTDGQTTAYRYDVQGNLRGVTQADGTVIDYVLDGRGRRVGKQVNGVSVQGFLYQDRLRPVAELNGAGSVVATFVYGSRKNVPDYVIKGGVAYRIIADQLGSPRLVVHAATGAVVQRLDYDEWGNVLLDTTPGFQPFGFAGGLYDRNTGLVRFGERDYDARTGRWTGKDPIGFAGGDTNLYGYGHNDPLNRIDPTGRMVLVLGAVVTVAEIAVITVTVIGVTVGVAYLTHLAATNHNTGTSQIRPPKPATIAPGDRETIPVTRPDVLPAPDTTKPKHKPIEEEHNKGTGCPSGTDAKPQLGDKPEPGLEPYPNENEHPLQEPYPEAEVGKDPLNPKFPPAPKVPKF